MLQQRIGIAKQRLKGTHGENSVSLTAHGMQQAGVIRIGRGHIEALDLDSLRKMACTCASKIQAYYDALFGDDTKRFDRSAGSATMGVAAAAGLRSTLVTASSLTLLAAA